MREQKIRSLASAPVGPLELQSPDQQFVAIRSLEAITEADSVYVNASGYLGRAVATASATMHAIGLAFQTTGSGLPTRVIVAGPFHSANINASGYIGRFAYAATAAGAPQTTPPSSSGQLVQVVGHYIDGSSIQVAIQGAFQRGGTL